MKNTFLARFRVSSLREAPRHCAALIAALVIAAATAMPSPAHAASPSAAATPYTFIGRLMDSSHAGFDASRACTIRAFDEDGNLLVESTTFFYADRRNNYSLQIPYSTSPAAGYAVKGSLLNITVTDEQNKTWSGVIQDPFCGPAGEIREVDIVLSEDKDGDGFDDKLFAQLKDDWTASEYRRRGEAFDPNQDHDGDGMSTIDEAYAGTNPFDPEDVLCITAFSVATDSGEGVGEIVPGQSQAVISFPTVSGRAYSISATTNLSSGAWSSAGFYSSPAATGAAHYLSVPSTSPSRPVSTTLYLLPTENASGFFRVKAE